MNSNATAAVENQTQNKFDADLEKLTSRVQKLRSVRDAATAPFYQKPNNGICESKNLSPEGHEDAVSLGSTSFDSTRSQKKHHKVASERNYQKLQASVKLLSESLEETSKLRALLEYTADTALVESLQQLVQSRAELLDDDDNDATADNIELKLHMRAMSIEQEQLVEQMVTLRSELEEEKAKALKLERELSVTSELLQNSQVECDALRDQLETALVHVNANNHAPASSSVDSYLEQKRHYDKPAILSPPKPPSGLKTRSYDNHHSHHKHSSSPKRSPRKNGSNGNDKDIEALLGSTGILGLSEMRQQRKNEAESVPFQPPLPLEPPPYDPELSRAVNSPAKKKMHRTKLKHTSKSDDEKDSEKSCEAQKEVKSDQSNKHEDTLVPESDVASPPTDAGDAEKQNLSDRNSNRPNFTALANRADDYGARLLRELEESSDEDSLPSSTATTEDDIDEASSRDDTDALTPKQHKQQQEQQQQLKETPVNLSEEKIINQTSLELTQDEDENSPLELPNMDDDQRNSDEEAVPSSPNSAFSDVDVAEKTDETELNPLVPSEIAQCTAVAGADNHKADDTNNDILPQEMRHCSLEQADLESLSILDGETASLNSTNSPQDRDQDREDESIVLDIDIGDGRSDTVHVDNRTEAMMLAFQFVKKHNLEPHYFEPLHDYIKDTQRSLHHRSEDRVQKTLHDLVPLSPRATTTAVAEDDVGRSDSASTMEYISDVSTLSPVPAPFPHDSVPASSNVTTDASNLSLSPDTLDPSYRPDANADDMVNVDDIEDFIIGAVGAPKKTDPPDFIYCTSEIQNSDDVGDSDCSSSHSSCVAAEDIESYILSAITPEATSQKESPHTATVDINQDDIEDVILAAINSGDVVTKQQHQPPDGATLTTSPPVVSDYNLDRIATTDLEDMIESVWNESAVKEMDDEILDYDDEAPLNFAAEAESLWQEMTALASRSVSCDSYSTASNAATGIVPETYKTTKTDVLQNEGKRTSVSQLFLTAPPLSDSCDDDGEFTLSPCSLESDHVHTFFESKQPERSIEGGNMKRRHEESAPDVFALLEDNMMPQQQDRSISKVSPDTVSNRGTDDAQCSVASPTQYLSLSKARSGGPQSFHRSKSAEDVFSSKRIGNDDETGTNDQQYRTLRTDRKSVSFTSTMKHKRIPKEAVDSKIIDNLTESNDTICDTEHSVKSQKRGSRAGPILSATISAKDGAKKFIGWAAKNVKSPKKPRTEDATNFANTSSIVPVDTGVDDIARKQKIEAISRHRTTKGVSHSNQDQAIVMTHSKETRSPPQQATKQETDVTIAIGSAPIRANPNVIIKRNAARPVSHTIQGRNIDNDLQPTQRAPAWVTRSRVEAEPDASLSIAGARSQRKTHQHSAATVSAGGSNLKNISAKPDALTEKLRIQSEKLSRSASTPTKPNTTLRTVGMAGSNGTSSRRAGTPEPSPKSRTAGSSSRQMRSSSAGRTATTPKRLPKSISNDRGSTVRSAKTSNEYIAL